MTVLKHGQRWKTRNGSVVTLEVDTSRHAPKDGSWFIQEGWRYSNNEGPAGLRVFSGGEDHGMDLIELIEEN